MRGQVRPQRLRPVRPLQGERATLLCRHCMRQLLQLLIMQKHSMLVEPQTDLYHWNETANAAEARLSAFCCHCRSTLATARQNHASTSMTTRRSTTRREAARRQPRLHIQSAYGTTSKLSQLSQFQAFWQQRFAGCPAPPLLAAMCMAGTFVISSE